MAVGQFDSCKEIFYGEIECKCGDQCDTARPGHSIGIALESYITTTYPEVAPPVPDSSCLYLCTARVLDAEKARVQDDQSRSSGQHQTSALPDGHPTHSQAALDVDEFFDLLGDVRNGSIPKSDNGKTETNMSTPVIVHSVLSAPIASDGSTSPPRAAESIEDMPQPDTTTSKLIGLLTLLSEHGRSFGRQSLGSLSSRDLLWTSPLISYYCATQAVNTPIFRIQRV
ncbi:hypothetical protein AUP68_09902 [Ilyonectria robusta]